MTELAYRPGDRLRLSGKSGTVLNTTADGLVFVWDEPYRLYSHGAVARQWFLSYGHVAELSHQTAALNPVEDEGLPVAARSHR